MAAPWLAGCTSQDSATITLTTGGETDTFTQTPVPTSLQVQAVQSDGDGGQTTTTLADATLPATSVDLGSLDESASAVITVTGFDSNGAAVLSGQSLDLDFSNLPGVNIPIFVQRKGQFARLPNPLTDTRTSPLLAVLQGEYLLVTGGDDSDAGATTSLYDFLGLSPTTGPQNVFRAAQSIAIDGAIAWLFDGDGGTYFDFSEATEGDFVLPSGGGTFADIAGGQTLTDDSGVQYIVGATRTTGAPSQWVLEVDPNDTSNSSYPYGNATWHELATPRLGAAAAWVPGKGLIITGGSSAMLSGAELFSVSSSGALGGSVSLGYPADPSVGAGATAIDSGNVVIAGGILSGVDAGVRLIGTTPCMAAACTPTQWPGLPTAITSVQAFSSNGSNILAVGSEPDTASDSTPNPNAGLTHVYAIANNGTGVTEIPTKVPHTRARAIGSPLGSLVLVGGSAGGEIESFVP